MRLVLVAVLVAAAPAMGRPQIERGGVMNAASLLPAGLPGAALSPDGLFVVRGKQLSAGAVEIAVSGRTWNATIQEASETLIRAVAPRGIAYGPASVTVVVSGERSNPVDTRVVSASVGLFSLAGDGGGSASEFAVRRGQRVSLPVTGLGEEPGAARLEVFVGGRAATNVRSEVSAGIGFEVPKDAPLGCNVPVQVRTNGSLPSNVVTLRIETESTVCAGDERVRGLLSLKEAATGGYAIPFRARMLYELAPGEKTEIRGDAFVADIRTGRMPVSDGPFYLPTPGTCTIYAAPGSHLDLQKAAIGGFADNTRPLAAGTWTITRADGASKTILPNKEREYFDFGELAGSLTRESTSDDLFLRPGLLTVAASGSAEIERFRLEVRFPEAVVWTNRSSVDVVNRSRDLEIKWTGGTNAWVAIAGVNTDLPSRVTSGFLCVAPKGTHEFKVPVPILQSLTASRGRWDESTGYVVVGAFPDTDVIAPVTDSFLGMGAVFDGRTVRFQ